MANNWKTQCNYRRLRQKDGSVKNIIFVDGQKVEVTNEVYKAYSQMGRQERYQEEQKENCVLSLERLREDNMRLEYLTNEYVPSAEEAVLAKEDEAMCAALIAKLSEAIKLLNEADRTLIHVLFMDGIPVREYARYLGVSDMAVRKRRDRILGKLQDFLTFFLQ